MVALPDGVEDLLMTNDALRRRHLTDATTGRRPIDRPRLEALMARMAAGDDSAFGEFRLEYADRLEGLADHVARQAGTVLPAAELASVATQMALELQRSAAGWRPDGGSLPWVWARPRMASIVRAELVAPNVSDRMVDRAEPERSTAAADDDVLAMVRRIHSDDPERAAVVARLDEVKERDRRVFLEFALQQAQGDPSPSHTVAEMLELQPANVRQIVRRVRQKVGLAA